MKTELILKEDKISEMIYSIKGERVMLDSDLAHIYNVETKALNRAVKRNVTRFPPDFMFQLSQEEWNNLKYQNGTSSWGGRRTLPFVFTEHGAIMLASVLNSERAIEASILVVRAFVKLRGFVLMSKEIAKRLEDFEENTNRKLIEHDQHFKVVFATLKKVFLQESKPRNRIGFIKE